MSEALMYVMLIGTAALLAMWYIASRKLKGRKVAGR
jgi:hypothetical protein